MPPLKRVSCALREDPRAGHLGQEPWCPQKLRGPAVHIVWEICVSLGRLCAPTWSRTYSGSPCPRNMSKGRWGRPLWRGWRKAARAALPAARSWQRQTGTCEDSRYRRSNAPWPPGFQAPVRAGVEFCTVVKLSLCTSNRTHKN